MDGRLVPIQGDPHALLFLLGLFLMAAPWLISAEEQKNWGKVHPILSLDADGVNVWTLGPSYRVPWQAIASFRVTSVRRRRRKVLCVGAEGSGEELSRRDGPLPSAAP